MVSVVNPLTLKLCEVTRFVPVSLRFNWPLFVPYRITPVVDRSVLKEIMALAIPMSSTFTLEASEIRFTTMEVDPVFQEKSVAIAVMVLAPFVKLVITLVHVPKSRVAPDPFTKTLATPPESETVPVKVTEPVIIAPLA
jgi:hypothetical protein